MENISNIIKKNSKKESIIFCSLIFLGSLGFRLFYFPHEIPIVVDGVDYFLYATEISILKNLPQDWIVVNNGWPIFLSFWFSIMRFEETQQYMELQRIITIIISSATIIPIYFICKNFVEPKYAVLGGILFGLDPRIILNSFLGGTDPLYIFLGSISLCLLLKNKRNFIYAAFGFGALCAIVRGEGIFFLAALTIIFFVRNKINFESIKIFVPSIIIYSIILIPILLQRIEISGTDGVFLRATTATIETSVISKTNSYENIISGIELFIKFFIWILIPNLIIFVPVGFIKFLKNRTRENSYIIIFLVTMSLPALYAYSVPASDTRYLYFLFPILAVLSTIGISTYHKKIKLKNSFLLIIMVGIVISSILFYEYKKDDWRMNNDIERENVEIAKDIILIADGVNLHPTESRYIRSLQIPNEWPYLYKDIQFETKSIPWFEDNSLENYIKNNKKELTHIIVDDNYELPEFLIDVYHNNKKYDYLTLVEDYQNLNYNSKFKIFEIDYERFNLIHN